MMFDVLSYLSIIKQKTLCNSVMIIYTNEPTHCNIVPKIKITCHKVDYVGDLYKFQLPEKYNKKFEYFLNNRCILFLATHKDAVVGHYFACNLNNFKPYLYNHYELFKGPNRHLLFFCHTFYLYRGMNIYPYVLNQICKEINSEPGNIFISTDLDNLASQRGIEKAGFKRVGILKYKRILSYNYSTAFSNHSNKER